MKRLLSVLLAFLLMVGFGAVSAHAAEEEDELVLAAAVEDDISGDFTDPAFLAKVYEITGIEPGEPIYPSDVNKIQDLNISRLGIESLDGLEHFTELRIFYCNYNPLKGELDLTANQALEKVHVFVTNSELTSVIVTGLNELQVLDLSYNLMKTFDASNLPSLLELYLTHNDLTSLDITNTPSLRKLVVTRNEFKSKADIIGKSEEELDALDVFAYDPQGKEPIDTSCPECGEDPCVCGKLPEIVDKKEIKFLTWIRTGRNWAWLLLLLVPFLAPHSGAPFFLWFLVL